MIKNPVTGGRIAEAEASLYEASIVLICFRAQETVEEIANLRKRHEVKQMSQPLEDISPETATKIAAQAKALGLSIDQYLRSLLPDEPNQPRQLTPAEKAQRWCEWTSKHSVKHVVANDCRESIYTREDNAL